MWKKSAQSSSLITLESQPGIAHEDPFAPAICGWIVPLILMFWKRNSSFCRCSIWLKHFVLQMGKFYPSNLADKDLACSFPKQYRSQVKFRKTPPIGRKRNKWKFQPSQRNKNRKKKKQNWSHQFFPMVHAQKQTIMIISDYSKYLIHSVTNNHIFWPIHACFYTENQVISWKNKIFLSS